MMSDKTYIGEDIERAKEDLKNAIDDLDASKLTDFYHNRSTAVSGKRTERVEIILEYEKVR